MRNVAGLSQTEALKSSDLFMKCRYMDELTGNRGIVFATGTPISNSMTEMYTMQRYLQYDALCSHGLQHFDAWASTFGETITATGNPYIREKMDLEIEVSRLKLVKANYLSQKYMLEDSLLKHYPKEIRLTQERIKGYKMDIALYERHKSEDFPGMLLYGTHYAEKKEAGTAILEACKAMISPEPKEVGSYRGFTLLLSYDIVAKVFRMTLRGELSHTVEFGSDIHGNIQRMCGITTLTLTMWLKRGIASGTIFAPTRLK